MPATSAATRVSRARRVAASQSPTGHTKNFTATATPTSAPGAPRTSRRRHAPAMSSATRGVRWETRVSPTTSGQSATTP